MKKLNYAKYLITKELLPLFIVFTVIGLISYFAYLMNVDFYDPYYNEISLAALNGPMMAFAIVLPLFIFNYKYSLKRSDTYYQLPLKQGELKNIRIISGLFILVVSYLIASLLPYVSFVIRYVSAPEAKTWAGITYFKYFEAAPYLGAIVVGLFTIVIEYFISCFFCSLTSKPVSALILNISLQLVLSFSLYVVFKSIYNLNFYNFAVDLSHIDDAANISILYSPGVVTVIGLPDHIARVYAFDLNSIYPIEGSSAKAVFTLCNVLEVLVGALACFFTLFRKDNSGENCNNYGFANKKLNSLFFLSTIPVALFVIVQNPYFGFEIIIGTVIVAAAYYFLFALFIGSFKMPGYSYAIIGAMSALVIFGCLFFAATTKTLI